MFFTEREWYIHELLHSVVHIFHEIRYYFTLLFSHNLSINIWRAKVLRVSERKTQIIACHTAISWLHSRRKYEELSSWSLCWRPLNLTHESMFAKRTCSALRPPYYWLSWSTFLVSTIFNKAWFMGSLANLWGIPHKHEINWERGENYNCNSISESFACLPLFRDHDWYCLRSLILLRWGEMHLQLWSLRNEHIFTIHARNPYHWFSLLICLRPHTQLATNVRKIAMKDFFWKILTRRERTRLDQREFRFWLESVFGPVSLSQLIPLDLRITQIFSLSKTVDTFYCRVGSRTNELLKSETSWMHGALGDSQEEKKKRGKERITFGKKAFDAMFWGRKLFWCVASTWFDDSLICLYRVCLNGMPYELRQNCTWTDEGSSMALAPIWNLTQGC